MVDAKNSFPRPSGPEIISYQGRMLEIVTYEMEVAPNKLKTFEWARRSPGVRIIVTRKQGQEILLTREYRHEIGDYDYRLAGGKVFNSLSEYNAFLSGEGDIIAAARDKVVGEALEETGIIVKSAKHIHTSKLGATVEWDLLYFHVNDFDYHPNGQQLDGEGEDITVQWLSFEEAKLIILDAQMSEERSALVLLRFIK